MIYIYFLKDYEFCDEFLKEIEKKINFANIINFAKVEYKNHLNTRDIIFFYSDFIKTLKSHQQATINYPYIQKLCHYL